MNYFEKHNKKQNESIEKFNKKVRLLNYEKQQEEYEIEHIIRSRRKARLEYKENRGTWIALDWFYKLIEGKSTFILYSELTEEEKDKYIEFWNLMHKHF